MVDKKEEQSHMEQMTSLSRWQKVRDGVRSWIEQKLPTLTQSRAKIVVFSLSVCMALLLAESVRNHWAYVIPGVILSGFCLIFIATDSAQAQKNKDHKGLTLAEQKMFFALGALALFWPLIWLVYGFWSFVNILILIVALMCAFEFKILPANWSTLAICQAMALTIALSVAWAIPSDRVSETYAGTFAYQERTKPFAFLGSTYKMYHNLPSSGSMSFSNLPENWTVTATFSLNTEYENINDGFRFFAKLYSVTADSISFTIPLPDTVELSREGEPVKLVTEYLEEKYPFLHFRANATYEYIERESWTD